MPSLKEQAIGILQALAAQDKETIRELRKEVSIQDTVLGDFHGTVQGLVSENTRLLNLVREHNHETWENEAAYEVLEAKLQRSADFAKGQTERVEGLEEALTWADEREERLQAYNKRLRKELSEVLADSARVKAFVKDTLDYNGVGFYEILKSLPWFEVAGYNEAHRLHQKLEAIKIVRRALGGHIGLKVAKEFVEKHWKYW